MEKKQSRTQLKTRQFLRLMAIATLVLILAACGQVSGDAVEEPVETEIAVEPEAPPIPQIQCPIDGTMVFELPNRPILVTIDNNAGARPQTGLNSADLVYEVPVEGGLTRYLALFYHGEADVIGPVRSARPYLIDLSREWDAVYIHAGHSPQAATYFSKTKIAHINEIYHPQGFYRDSSRRAPHNLYSGTSALRVEITKMGFDKESVIQGYRFRTENQTVKGTLATTLKIAYAYHSVGYEYNETTDMYLRYVNGKHSSDLVSNEQHSAANVLIQEVDLKSFDSEGRLEVKLIGEGKAMLFTGSRMQAGTWKKESVTNRTVFYDESGTEVYLKPGQTWIHLVSHGTAAKITYQ